MPRTGAVLLRLNSVCCGNAWDEKAELDKVPRAEMRSSTASLGFYTRPQTRRVEISGK